MCFRIGRGDVPLFAPLPIHCVRSANRQSWGQAPPRLVGKPLTSRKRYRRILNSSLKGLVHGWRKVQILGSCRRDPGQGPQPFLLRTPGRSPRPEPPRFSAPPLNTGSSESVHQVLSPSKMPGNCLPSLPLPCTIITLIVHGTTSPGPLPSTLFFASERMFPRERQLPSAACAYPRFWKAAPANPAPTSLAHTPWSVGYIWKVSLSKM